MQEVYKVVRVIPTKRGEKYVSSFGHEYLHERPSPVTLGAILPYGKRRTTRPKIRSTKLFAFFTLEEARSHAAMCIDSRPPWGFKIFLAQATNVTWGYMAQWPFYDRSSKAAFRRQYLQEIKDLSGGTVALCGSIRLLEEV